MGGIIKSYREWKISGDDEWLKKNWPAIKKSLAYAWEPTNENRWDADKDGVLEGRCHHTLDVYKRQSMLMANGGWPPTMTSRLIRGGLVLTIQWR